MSSLHHQYLDEIRTERAKFLTTSDTVFTGEDLLSLPAPVKRYLQTCGYAGTKKRPYGRILWEDVKLRLSPRGKWRDIVCYEFLASPEPLRIAHLKTRIAGLLPLEAKDKYQCGHGHMVIQLANLLTVRNVSGSEMDQSALVTFLSECLLLPAIALQPYIRWSDVSENCAMATIRHHGTTAAGFFHFNDHDEFARFETEHRWKTLPGGKFEQTHWMTEVSEYDLDRGIFRPGKAIASWVYEDHREDYFIGKIRGIQ